MNLYFICFRSDLNEIKGPDKEQIVWLLVHLLGSSRLFYAFYNMQTINFLNTQTINFLVWILSHVSDWIFITVWYKEGNNLLWNYYYTYLITFTSVFSIKKYNLKKTFKRQLISYKNVRKLRFVQIQEDTKNLFSRIWLKGISMNIQTFNSCGINTYTQSCCCLLKRDLLLDNLKM